MQDHEFYSRQGIVNCYTVDGEYIYLWNGRPVAYLYEDKVYNMSGRMLGWLYNGWLYDRQNRPALFSPTAIGGPARPARSVKPVKSVRSVRPVKGVRQVPLVKPARSITWSKYSEGGYFDQ